MRRPMEPNQIFAALLAEFGRSLVALSEIMMSGPSVVPENPGSHLAITTQRSDMVKQRAPRVRESNPSPLPKPDTESSPKMRRAILITLAQYGRAMTPEQIGIYSGKAHKGGAFLRALGDLKAENKVAGLIGGKVLQITAAGFEELGDWARLPEGMALFEHWCGKLGEMAELILRCLLEYDARDAEEIGELINRAHKGGAFIRALSQLRKMQLVVSIGKKYALSPDLRRAVAPSVRVYNTATGHEHRVDAHKGHAR